MDLAKSIDRLAQAYDEVERALVPLDPFIGDEERTFICHLLSSAPPLLEAGLLLLNQPAESSLGGFFDAEIGALVQMSDTLSDGLEHVAALATRLATTSDVRADTSAVVVPRNHSGRRAIATGARRGTNDAERASGPTPRVQRKKKDRGLILYRCPRVDARHSGKLTTRVVASERNSLYEKVYARWLNAVTC